jgi:hypothetical protein
MKVSERVAPFFATMHEASPKSVDSPENPKRGSL